MVPVGVDPELLTPQPHIRRKPDQIITTASADVTMKGLRYLLEAVAKVRTERDLNLVVIGKLKEDGAAARAIEGLGLSGSIQFISGVPDQRIVDLYAESTMAVVPSLYEGFSLPAIEAMSCGIPLLATTGGALPEVTGTDGETCFQVEPGDSDALAAGIRRVLAEPKAAAAIGLAGRERVINRWSWRHTAEQTVEHYRALLEESGSGA